MKNIDIELAVFDVDDTILNDDHELYPSVKHLLHRMHDEGIIIGLATGRTKLMVEHIIEKIGLTMPLILLNGAWIHDMRTGRDLRGLNLARETAVEIVKSLRKWGYEIIVQKGVPEAHFFYYDTIDENNLERVSRIDRNHFRSQRVGDLLDVLNENPGEITVLDKRERVDHCRELLKSLNNNFKITYSISPFNKNYAWLELLHKDADKGKALQYLAGHLGIDRKNVLAIGDNYNDMEMIKWAGIGTAVAAAVPELQEAADIVLGGEENGLQELHSMLIS